MFRALRVVGYAWALACAVACGDELPRPNETPSATASPGASSPVRDPSPEPPRPHAWPADVEDLAQHLDSFDASRCVAALRTDLPTDVSEGLADLGYDGFLDDVCASLAAVRARSTTACDALSVDGLRRGCRRRVALMASDPMACGSDPLLPGRDAVCLAWASRDPSLCRAAAPEQRAGCSAALSNDVAECARARSAVGPRALVAASREACAAMVQRYGRALEGERRPSVGAVDEPSFEFTATRSHVLAGGRNESEAPSHAELANLARGVVLVPEDCAYRVVLDERGAHALRGAPFRDSAHVELVLPGDVIEAATPFPIDGSRFVVEVSLRGRGTASASEGTIEVEAFAPSRGASVRGRFEAALLAPSGSLRVLGTFRTFVRDLEPLDPSCAMAREAPP